MSSYQLCFDVRSDDPDFTVTFFMDGEKLKSPIITDEWQTLRYDFDKDSLDHVFEIKMSGKTSSHTKIDNQGNILDDKIVEIKKFFLDDIDVESILHKTSQYIHDHNGSTVMGKNRFFGILGCNGTVRLEFYSPVPLWFLDNTININT